MNVAVETLWRMVPVPVLILDRMPNRLVGLSMGLFIVIRRDYAADRPTVVHELEHCKQFWRGGVLLHMIRYYLSRDYRLRMEVEAFLAEIAACDATSRTLRLDDAARALATGYHIGLDVHACRSLLSYALPSRPFAPSSRSSPKVDAAPLTFSPPVMARSTDSTRR